MARPDARPTNTHLLSRRMVLSDMGKGTLAVALLGTAAISCSSDGDQRGIAPTVPNSPTAAPAPATAAPDPTATAEPDAAPAEEPPADARCNGQPLAWEQVSFGFVSAYVLARGNEVAIVDTGTGDAAGSTTRSPLCRWGGAMSTM